MAISFYWVFMAVNRAHPGTTPRYGDAGKFRAVKLFQ